MSERYSTSEPSERIIGDSAPHGHGRGLSVVVRFAAAVVVVALAAGCMPLIPPSAPETPADVTIGVMVPLSGPDAAAGDELSQGAELAAELVNDPHPDIELPLAAEAGLPRLGGARLQLTVRDTKGDPGAATLATDVLTGGHNPSVLVAGGRPDAVAAMAVAADRRHVPLLDVTTSSGALLEAGRDWYFRTGPSDRILGEAAFALLGGRPKPVRSVGLAQPADGRQSALVSAVEDLAAETGTAIASRARYGAGQVQSAGRKAAGGSPGAVVLVAESAGEAAGLVRGVRSASANVPVLGLGPGFAEPAFADAAGGAGANVLISEVWSARFPARNAVAKGVAVLYERRYGHPMTALAASAFTAVWTAAMGIDAAGSGRASDVRSALLAADHPGTALIMPWSGIRFETGGQNAGAAAVIEQIRPGGPEIVFPGELATGTLQWPGPPAGSRG
jgi:branched-chain amino acid transport system substrate-binding protein